MNSARKVDVNVKTSSRRIDGWTGTLVKIEREGDTVHIQCKTPKGLETMVLPLTVAEELLLILGDATAPEAVQVGAVIPYVAPETAGAAYQTQDHRRVV